MAKVTRNPFPAPLKPEDIDGEAAVLTVKSVLVDVASDKNRRGKVTVIETWEHERKGLYLNASSIDAAIEGFGSDESDNWTDKKFPVIKVHSEYEDRTTGKKTMQWVLWVAPADQWAKLIKSLKAAAKTAK